MRRIATAVALVTEAIALLAMGACAPASPSRFAGPEGAERGPSKTSPKVLTLAMGKEPDAWNTDLVRVTRGGGITFLTLVVHNKLTVEAEAFAYVPQLAVEQISVEKGTWRINPDKTMTTTWRIHQNVKWHDGVPFTSDDLMFTFNVMKDPEVPNTVGAGLRILQAAEQPDPYTFVIHWAGPYVNADQAPWLFPMPKHLLEDAYRRDRASFPSHPWMTTEFVGLGAYRLARWERGSYIEFARFDDYFKGRPPFDTVVMRFMGDENGMIAAVLAGQVDLDRKSTRLNSSHIQKSRMPSSA